MTNERTASGLRRGVLFAGTAAAGLALIVLGVAASRSSLASARVDAEETRSVQCRTLARVAGPEDMVLDAARQRLLVSAVDRRARPKEDGAIWRVPPAPADDRRRQERRMILSGRDGCSFRPHGIDLLPGAGGGADLLYVVNHHDGRDARPESRCFDSDDAIELVGHDSGEEVTSIEVFEIEDDLLRFVRRLAAPAVLTGGNDLVALPGGDLWITVPPRGKALLAERFGGGRRSRLVHFDCRGGGLRCGGTWRRLEPPPAPEGGRPRYLNGIAWRPGVGNAPDELYAASTITGEVFAYAIERDDSLRAVSASCGSGLRGPDNLTWLDERREVLLAAAHPSETLFARYALSAAVAAPSEVWQLATASMRPQRIFRDGGERIGAASTALCVGGDLVLGQVFGDRIERCVLAESCQPPARPWPAPQRPLPRSDGGP